MLTFWQRGHFVVTAQAVFPASQAAPPELWLSELVGTRTYELILSDILRRELR